MLPVFAQANAKSVTRQGVIVARTIKKPTVNGAASRPAVQHVGDQQRSRNAANSNHRQMAAILDAVEFQDHRIARVAPRPGAYLVDMVRAIGTGRQTKIVIRPGTNELVTGYPVP